MLRDMGHQAYKLCFGFSSKLTRKHVTTTTHIMFKGRRPTQKNTHLEKNSFFHSLTKENQVSLLRIFLSEPDSDGQSTDLGVGGGKKDPEVSLFDLNAAFLACNLRHSALRAEVTTEDLDVACALDAPDTLRGAARCARFVCVTFCNW